MGRTVTKSIAIIGEGETEWFYFDSLRVACRYPFKVAPDFPQHSDINHILKLVESYLNKQYDFIVCLFDMDRLYQYPSEMHKMPGPTIFARTTSSAIRPTNSSTFPPTCGRRLLTRRKNENPRPEKSGNTNTHHLRSSDRNSGPNRHPCS